MSYIEMENITPAKLALISERDRKKSCVSVHELNSLTEGKRTCTKRHLTAIINRLAARGQRPWNLREIADIVIWELI